MWHAVVFRNVWYLQLLIDPDAPKLYDVAMVAVEQCYANQQLNEVLVTIIFL